MLKPKSSCSLFSSCLLLLVTLAVSSLAGCGGGGSSSPSGAILIVADVSSVAAGETTQLHAIESAGLNAANDVTDSVTWNSSNPAIATVSATGLVRGIASGSVTLSASLASSSASTKGSMAFTVSAPVATSLSVAPAAATVNVGGIEQYKAIATLSDQSTRDVSASTTWSVSPASVATMSNSGLLTAVASGSYTVKAVNGALSASAPGQVAIKVLASIAVTPANPTVAGGASQQFSATGTYTDQSTADLTKSVVWSSSNPNVLTINAAGLGKALGADLATTVTVTATLASNLTNSSSAVTGNALVMVTPGKYLTGLQVKPTSSSIAYFSAEQHQAIAYYSDGSQADVTSSVTWSVTSSMDGTGQVRSGDLPHAGAKAAIGASTPHPSDTGSVVTVNQSGIDSALTPGSAIVKAALGPLSSQSVVLVTSATIVSLSISSNDETFPVGSQQLMQLTGVFSDGSTQNLSTAADWTSSNTAVATVDSNGWAIGVAAGAVQFSASFGGLSATSPNFQITSRQLVSTVIGLFSPVFPIGASEQLSVTGTYSDGSMQDLSPLATWSSADPTIVRVDSNGVAYGLSSGDTQITATVFGRSTVASVFGLAVTLQSMQILPDQAKFALGTTLDFEALGQFSTGSQINVTQPVLWVSQNPAVLTIDANGRAKSGQVGTTRITASLLGVTAFSTNIAVTNATIAHLSMSPAVIQIAAHTNTQFTASGFFSDGSFRDLTPDVSWTSSNDAVARIDASGLAFGITPGVVDITATFMGESVVSRLTVTSAQLLSVGIVPASVELPITVSRQFNLVGSFSDGTTQDLTNDAAWFAPTPSIVTVEGKGEGTGVSVGEASLSAQRGFFTASTPVNVTSAALSSITLTPAANTIREGSKQQLIATGVFTDGFTQDLALNALFSSADPSVAATSQAGVIWGVGVGSTAITASFEGKNASTTSFHVLSDVLSSIAIMPSAPIVDAGSTAQLTATGVFADQSTADVTEMVSWRSSNPALLSVDQTGLLTASSSVTAVTAVTVAAEWGQTSRSATVTIEPAGTSPVGPTLSRIDVTPTSVRLAVGTAQRFRALGSYSDGSSKDLTSLVSWRSASPSTASVLAAGQNAGLVTAAATGTTSVTATLGSGSTALSGQSTVIVSTAALTSLAITPTNPSLAKGVRQQLSLIGAFSDNSRQDLTDQASWNSMSTGVATVGSGGAAQGAATSGLLTGVGLGTAEITAGFGGKSTSAMIAVTAPQLLSLAFVPGTASFAEGTEQQFRVLGVYADGTAHDLTNATVFTSSNTGVLKLASASTDDTRDAGLAIGVAAGTASVTASVDGLTSTSGVITVTAATLETIAITPDLVTLADGTTQQFKATGSFSDVEGNQTVQDLTSQVVWRSSNPQVVTINSSGVGSGNAAGSVTVTATMGSIQTTSGPILVTAAGLTGLVVTPVTATVPEGATKQFKATGSFTDGSSQDLSSRVTWSATGTANGSNSAVASVNASGLATATALGTSTVNATFDGQTAGAVFNVTAATLVSIGFTPANATLAAGADEQIEVIGTFSDGTTENLTASAIFASSNLAVATVSLSGIVHGVAPGSGTLTVEVFGKTSSLPVVITNALLSSIAITPAGPASLAKGRAQQFQVMGSYSDGSTQPVLSGVIWRSSNLAVLTVDSSGLAQAIGLGSAAIGASYAGKSTTTATFTVTAAEVTAVTVTPEGATLAAGATVQYQALATYTDGTTGSVTATVAWSSSNTSAATIVSSGVQAGLAAGVAPGTANLIAVLTTASGSISGFTSLTVIQAPVTLMAITVKPTSSRIATGTAEQLLATGGYSDGSLRDLTGSVSWTSLSPGTATISPAGLVTGVSPGTATVQAQIVSGLGSGSGSNHSTAPRAAATLTSTATVVVSAATLTSISISPSGVSLATGERQQFTLTGSFSDGSRQDVTADAATSWSSTASAIATVNASGTGAGLATAVSAGSTQISASYQGMTATTSVQVTAAALESVAITPQTASFAKGTTQQFGVIGSYSDGTTRDLSGSATFSSSDSQTVSIVATGTGAGLATGTAIGSAQITGLVDGKSAETQTVTVTAATLVSLLVTPSSPSFADGTTEQFTVTGTFSDGTTEDLTGQAVWTSSNPQVLTINAAGLASGGTPGSVQVTASFGGISVSTGTVQVSAATLNGLTLTPTTATVAKGTTQQFTATGAFTDGTTENLSSTVTWTSSNPAVVSINANGLATGTGAGQAVITAQITAQSQSRSVSTTSFQVTAATLVSIAFTPPNPSLAAGSGAQITVIGTFSDGTTEDLTPSAVFTSSNPSAVSVSPQGVVTGIAPGSSTITVQADGKTSSFTVSVTNATLTSLTIAPATPALVPKGATEQFTATGHYSDGTTQDLTTTVNWTTSDGTLATISSNGLLTGVSPGNSTVTASYQGKTASSASFQIGPAQVASIAVTPAAASVVAGATEQYQAIATYTDNSTADVSSSAAWSTADASIATINISGLATGVAAGSTTVSATLAAGANTGPSPIVGSTMLTVTAPPPALQSITVTPTSSHIASGTTQQFSAQGMYSNASNGSVTRIGVGIGFSGNSSMKAVGHYSNGTQLDLSNLVSWTSSNINTATISTTGLARGVAPGTAIMTAQLGNLTSQATVVVTAATLSSVAISPSGASLASGTSQQFTLTGTFSDGSTQDLTSAAIWSSLAPGVATVSVTGLATGVMPGTAQISAVYGGMSAATSVQVTAATLTSVALTPATVNFAKGTMQQFQVIGSYSDGSTQNLTGIAAYSTSDPTVVTVSATGIALGVGTGSVQISATVGGFTAMTQAVTVTPATLVSIILSPTSTSFADGTTVQFMATGTFSDGSSQNLTSQVVWSSSNAQVLTISTSGLASGNGVGNVQIWASSNGVSAYSGTIQVTQAVLTGIVLTPSSAQIAKGTSQQFTATGQFTDGTTQNLSSNVTWISSNPTVVTISATGLATATGIGSAQITALFGGQSASTSSFAVTPATLLSIAFNPPSPSIAAGTAAQISVIGTFSDGTMQDLTASAQFVSSNPAAVMINSSGMATGVAAGSSTIAVTVDGMISSFVVTVTSATLNSIAITPATPAALPKGATEQFIATGSYSDGSTQNLTSAVTWTSLAPFIATVNSSGLVTGTGVGSTQLTAGYQGQTATSASFPVTAAVVASITVTLSSSSINVGATEQSSAMATYTDNSTMDVSATVTWASSSPGVATINNNGLASAAGTGSTTISAALNGLTGNATLTVTAPAAVTLSTIAVTPSTASVAKGNTQQFTATGQYSDGSTQNLSMLVAWQSSVPSVATIDSNGLATTLAGGNTQIWASYQGVSTVVTLTVSPATLVSLVVTPGTVNLADGTSQQFKAVGTLSDGSTQDLTNSVTWTSSNNNTATVSSTGLAVSHGTGNATIQARAGAQTATATLSVTAATATVLQISPSSVSLPAGGTQQLQVTATFTDGSSEDVTNSATYTSSNAAIATVNASGDVDGVSGGTTSITATLGTASASISATISSAVLNSIAITPASVTLAAGVSQQLTATGSFSDGSTQNLTNSVTWSTSSAHVATVSATGMVLAANPGTATITAVSGSVTATSTVTATSAVVTSLTVSPASTTLAAGQTQQFAAIATMSDGTQQTITTSVHWSVSDPTKGTISNSTGSNGFLTTTAAGTFQVTAAINSVSGSANVTVSAATLSSLAITPNPVSLPAGTTQALRVTGSYTDGSTANLTASATWSSASASVATVNSSGLVSGNSVGSTTITATVGTMSATDAVTVTSPVLQSIAITPSSVNLALGLTTQLTAIGTYQGGATANITSQVQWSSTAPSVATVSGTGLLSTLHSGSASVTATLNSVSAQIPVTVTPAVLQSITVQATQPSFALGQSVQLTAVGTYSDSSTQVLTSSVTWSSGTPSVGVVSSSGLATGVTPGSFSARATLNGITGSLTLTVTSAVLQSIVVTPTNEIIVNISSNGVQYTATGHYSDGTTQNLTNSVHWTLSGLTLGSISSTGLFSPEGVGVGTVTATSGTISGSANLMVVAL